jgi:uncharacterized membrane protein YcgQ (UPF0703/DUF1980 family)
VSFVKGFAAGMAGKSEVEQTSRLMIDGLAYIKINLVELSLVCEKAQPEEMAKPYVVRGMVRRSQKLDDSGQFALLRTAVFCCVADAVAMGFRVSYDRLDELTDGQWVEVYGRITSLADKLPETGLPAQGWLPPVMRESQLFIPDKIVAMEAPEIPFIFEVRPSEPYAY